MEPSLGAARHSEAISPGLLAIQGWAALLASSADFDEMDRERDRIRSGAPDSLAAEKKALAKVVVDFIALVKTGPTPEAYAGFYFANYVPAYNAVHARCPRCVKCGRVFRKRDRPTCSTRCDANLRMEGKDKVGGGRSAAERAMEKMGQRAKRHMEKCEMCQRGTLCPIREKYLVASTTDADDRAAFSGRRRRQE